jgi:hypothetical protein
MFFSEIPTHAYLLKEANSLTKVWAEEIIKKQFPLGVLDFRNSPLDQSRKFKPYTWINFRPCIRFKFSALIKWTISEI